MTEPTAPRRKPKDVVAQDSTSPPKKASQDRSTSTDEASQGHQDDDDASATNDNPNSPSKILASNLAQTLALTPAAREQRIRSIPRLTDGDDGEKEQDEKEEIEGYQPGSPQSPALIRAHNTGARWSVSEKIGRGDGENEQGETGGEDQGSKDPNEDHNEGETDIEEQDDSFQSMSNFDDPNDES